jgi:hypothetical protein
LQCVSKARFIIAVRRSEAHSSAAVQDHESAVVTGEALQLHKTGRRGKVADQRAKNLCN